MDTAPPPRRQAAIKATTQLADISSSDEDHAIGNQGPDYVAGQRVKGPKSKKGSKGKGSRNGKRSNMGSVDLGVGGSGSNVRKRKRGISIVAGSLQKRQRGHDRSLQQGKGSDGEESDLTPLSSEDEPEGPRPLLRPLAEFPLQFTPPGPSSAKQAGSSKPQDLPPLEMPDLEDDSDDLPDVGMVLSQQQDVSSSKRTRYRKHDTSTRKRKSSTRLEHTRDNSPYSPPSSPTLPPTISPSSLVLSSRRDPLDDDATTEVNLSDFSDDSDLELNSVGIGELCLAKAKATETIYWPAKVLQTKKLITGKGTGRRKKIYRVMFLDKKEKDIPRDWLYTCSQDEFGTCTVGQFESSHIEVINDIDEESRRDCAPSSRRHKSSSVPRSPSPVTIPSPPLSGPEYCDLSLHQQFAYVIPVLKAIMNEEYTWGLRRHELYVKGEASRLKLKNEGGLKGAVDARSVDELLVLLEIWCLGCRGRDFSGDEDEDQGAESQLLNDPALNGDEREFALESVGSTSEAVLQSITIGVDVPNKDSNLQAIATELPAAEVPPSLRIDESPPLEGGQTEAEPNIPPPPPPTQPVSLPEAPRSKHKRPRQHGSPTYENLLALEKVQYCIEVLLPETLNQILLWRTGERKSVEVMWDNAEEEKRLHDRGEQLLRETDWVMDIMRLRQALKGMKKGEEKKKSVEEPPRSKGKELRKTRSGRVGSIVGSYKE